ncbi:MAG TPA: serine hydrolase domain-containing protein, partial [Herpetosiphonaceae bacterium]|nr:serine hydrolase domain-containing protein [Herpetosiphonaceae bacterium]
MAIDRAAIEAVVQQQTAAAPFSGVVLVHERGQTTFARAYGFAQRSEALPNTLATRFATASGSKTFTAVAICQLVARGLLAFGMPLTACVPVALPFCDPGVTIHQLLTHTSGIPDYFDEAVADDYGAIWHDVPMYRMRSPADFLPLLHNRPMQFAPGSRFHYNNAGFVILTLVVEHVAGMPFHRYVTQRVFEAGG